MAEIVAPTGSSKVGRGVKLPLGFPGAGIIGSHLPRDAAGPDDGGFAWIQVERLQFSFHPAAGAPKVDVNPWADIASVTMVFE